MADVTVSQFANVLKVPLEKLLSQLADAGIAVDGGDDIISCLLYTSDAADE